MIIYLAIPIARNLQRPLPEGSAGSFNPFLFGLAPGGACQASESPRSWWSLTPPFQLNPDWPQSRDFIAKTRKCERTKEPVVYQPRTSADSHCPAFVLRSKPREIRSTPKPLCASESLSLHCPISRFRPFVLSRLPFRGRAIAANRDLFFSVALSVADCSTPRR